MNVKINFIFVFFLFVLFCFWEDFFFLPVCFFFCARIFFNPKFVLLCFWEDFFFPKIVQLFLFEDLFFPADSSSSKWWRLSPRLTSLLWTLTRESAHWKRIEIQNRVCNLELRRQAIRHNVWVRRQRLVVSTRTIHQRSIFQPRTRTLHCRKCRGWIRTPSKHKKNPPT